MNNNDSGPDKINGMLTIKEDLGKFVGSVRICRGDGVYLEAETYYNGRHYTNNIHSIDKQGKAQTWTGYNDKPLVGDDDTLKQLANFGATGDNLGITEATP